MSVTKKPTRGCVTYTYLTRTKDGRPGPRITATSMLAAVEEAVERDLFVIGELVCELKPGDGHTEGAGDEN